MLRYLKKFCVFGGKAAKLFTLYFPSSLELQRFKPRQGIGAITP
jgi:hypothetical protein